MSAKAILADESRSSNAQGKRSKYVTVVSNKSSGRSTNYDAYTISVVAYGSTYDVPVTKSTRVGSVLREVAELAIPLSKARELGEVDAGLFHGSTALNIDSAIGNLPRDAVLHFHTSLDMVIKNRAATTIPMGAMYSFNGAAAAGLFQPFHVLEPQLHQVRNGGSKISPGGASDTLSSEPRTTSTSASPPGVSEKSSSNSPPMDSATADDNNNTQQQQHYASSPTITQQTLSFTSPNVSNALSFSSFNGMPGGSGGGQMMFLATSPGGAVSPFLLQPLPLASYRTLAQQQQQWIIPHAQAAEGTTQRHGGTTRPTQRTIPATSSGTTRVASVSPPPAPPESNSINNSTQTLEYVTEAVDPQTKMLLRDAEKATLNNEFYVVVYVHLQEGYEESTLIAAGIGGEPLWIDSGARSSRYESASASTARSGALVPAVGGGALRRLRIKRAFPLGTLRELFAVAQSLRIFKDGVIVEDEARTFREEAVRPNTIFSFASYERTNSEALSSERQRARLQSYLAAASTMTTVGTTSTTPTTSADKEKSPSPAIVLSSSPFEATAPRTALDEENCFRRALEEEKEPGAESENQRHHAPPAVLESKESTSPILESRKMMMATTATTTPTHAEQHRCGQQQQGVTGGGSKHKLPPLQSARANSPLHKSTSHGKRKKSDGSAPVIPVLTAWETIQPGQLKSKDHRGSRTISVRAGSRLAPIYGTTGSNSADHDSIMVSSPTVLSSSKNGDVSQPPQTGSPSHSPKKRSSKSSGAAKAANAPASLSPSPRNSQEMALPRVVYTGDKKRQTCAADVDGHRPYSREEEEGKKESAVENDKKSNATANAPEQVVRRVHRWSNTSSQHDAFEGTFGAAMDDDDDNYHKHRTNEEGEILDISAVSSASTNAHSSNNNNADSKINRTASDTPTLRPDSAYEYKGDAVVVSPARRGKQMPDHLTSTPPSLSLPLDTESSPDSCKPTAGGARRARSKRHTSPIMDTVGDPEDNYHGTEEATLEATGSTGKKKGNVPKEEGDKNAKDGVPNSVSVTGGEAKTTHVMRYTLKRMEQAPVFSPVLPSAEQIEDTMADHFFSSTSTKGGDDMKSPKRVAELAEDALEDLTPRYSVVSQSGKGTLRITLENPLDPTAFSTNVPVQPHCPVGVLREWLMEEVADTLSKKDLSIIIPRLNNRLEYGVFCGERRIVNDTVMTFFEATGGRNDCVFSLRRLL